jgi:hypothetical protein
MITRFPGLSQWIDTGNIALNEARLFLTATPYAEEITPPSEIILLQVLEDGSYAFTEDQTEGDDYFGGGLSDSSNSYQFRISFYMQDLFIGNTDYGLHLFPISKSIKANEVVLYGTGQNVPFRMKMELTYTKIN